MTRTSIERSTGELPASAGAAPLTYRAVVERGRDAERRGMRQEARNLYESALTRLSEGADDADASNLLRWIARTHHDDSDLELTLDCAEAALAVAEASANRGALRHASSLMAAVRVEQGELDEAERLYGRAQSGALQDGELTLVAMTAQNLGVVASIRGDDGTAQQYYEKSLAAYRALDLPADVCIVLGNLGLLHTQRQRWSAAAQAYDEAMAVAKQLRDRAAQMRVEVQRAEWAIAQRDYAAAHDACERARLLGILVPDAPATGPAHKAFGIVLRECGDFDRATHHFAEALGLGASRQDVQLLADTSRELAELYRRQGRNRDALESLDRAQCHLLQLRARRDMMDASRRAETLDGDFLEVARSWGTSIECNDRYSQGHSERVADIASALAAAEGMTGRELFWFRIGALLHDVGKVILPAELLNKPGQLTADEWAVMHTHPGAGVEMLAAVKLPWDVTPIVGSHHERWDGAGYPRGLAGEDIPRVARMVCIADVYDALTSERCYKAAMTHDEAMAVMRADVGRQFDGVLFARFEQVASEHAASWARGPESEFPAEEAWRQRAPGSPIGEPAPRVDSSVGFRLTAHGG